MSEPLTPRMNQDAHAHNELPARTATTGRVFLGYCLTIAAPAVGWIVESGGLKVMNARMITLSFVVAGALLVFTGNMARFGYKIKKHHLFGV